MVSKKFNNIVDKPKHYNDRNVYMTYFSLKKIFINIMEDKYKNLELLYNNIEESLVSLESQNSLLKLENEKLKDIIWQYERRIVIKI